jgi:FK506-binding protein 2
MAMRAENKWKLQIGVKKQVDHCPMKTHKGDILHMHYMGKLEAGTECDSGCLRTSPLSSPLAPAKVIKGWDQGHLRMCEGKI